LEGDDSVTLLLPKTLEEVLPTAPLAFRDRTLLDDDPRLVSRIEIRRADAPATLLETVDQGAEWKLLEPVVAPADAMVVRTMGVVLGRLRADRLASEAPTTEELAEAGLTSTSPTIGWTVSRPDGPPVTHVLHLGGATSGEGAGRFARLDGSPLLFTIAAPAVAALIAEPKVRQLLAIDPRLIDRLELEVGGTKYLAERPRPNAPPLRPVEADDWRISPRLPGLDAAGCERLARRLGGLSAGRFLQYGGPISGSMGLSDPRLAMTAVLRDGSRSKALRVGRTLGAGQVVATLGDGQTGAVFTLDSEPFDFLAAAPGWPSDQFAR